MTHQFPPQLNEKLLPLERQLDHLGPREHVHAEAVLEHEQPVGRHAQLQLIPVAVHRVMCVDAVHLEAFRVLQVIVLGVCGQLAPVQLVQLHNAPLHVLRLVAHQRHAAQVLAVRVLRGTEVAHLRLDGVAGEQEGGGQGALQPPLEDVPLQVQVEEVARVLLLQTARIVHEELDAEQEDGSGGQGCVATVAIVARPLLLEEFVGVDPSLEDGDWEV